MPLVCTPGSLFNEIKFNYQVCTIEVSLCVGAEQFTIQAPVLFYSKKIAKAGHILPCLNSQIQENAETVLPKVNPLILSVVFLIIQVREG